MRQRQPSYLHYVAFVALYLLLDWATYIDPLYGLNITPWNPDPALGLVFWLRYGRRAALPWFVALLAGELLIHHAPGGALVSVLGSLWLTTGYGMLGAALRRAFASGSIFDKRRRLFIWLGIVVAGTLVNDLGYIALLSGAGLIPSGQTGMALLRFGIGDIVGVVVSMPLIWVLSSEQGRQRLRATVWHGETLAYLGLSVCVLYGVFGAIASAEFKHFYLLFLPVIWAAARQGLYGTALIVFVLQTGIVSLVKWSRLVDIDVYELQLLDAVLALVGFFIGTVIDELRKLAHELRQSLRLAAAGEMAAALAHELNQPLTALAAYGKACELLLERGDTGPVLQNAIARMIIESGRAAEVVRRLRDFFRTGAMQLEAIGLGSLLQASGQQFLPQCSANGIVLTLPEPVALTVRADRLQLELVLRNLLANAIDAVLTMPAGQRRVTLTLERRGARQVRLSVRDSGHGVSEALAARLFEPFVSSKASGLGLGLVLSRAIVEAHGGSLWAEVGEGGIFHLQLPLSETGVAREP